MATKAGTIKKGKKATRVRRSDGVMTTVWKKVKKATKKRKKAKR